MKRDITFVLRKHIDELFQILSQYEIHDKSALVVQAGADMVFQKAILMNVGYIGELSKKLNLEIKDNHPEINWRRLGTSRNIIFHEYDIVDIEIISAVIFKDIKALRGIFA